VAPAGSSVGRALQQGRKALTFDPGFAEFGDTIRTSGRPTVSPVAGAHELDSADNHLHVGVELAPSLRGPWGFVPRPDVGARV
jgi:hypothetical protein